MTYDLLLFGVLLVALLGMGWWLFADPKL